jgi:hypothetical protein
MVSSPASDREMLTPLDDEHALTIISRIATTARVGMIVRRRTMSAR